jgi:hypothetical protein
MQISSPSGKTQVRALRGIKSSSGENGKDLRHLRTPRSIRYRLRVRLGSRDTLPVSASDTVTLYWTFASTLDALRQSGLTCPQCYSVATAASIAICENRFLAVSTRWLSLTRTPSRSVCAARPGFAIRNHFHNHRPGTQLPGSTTSPPNQSAWRDLPCFEPVARPYLARH